MYEYLCCYASCKLLLREANQKSITASEHDVTTRRLLYGIISSRHNKSHVCGDILSKCNQVENDQISYIMTVFFPSNCPACKSHPHYAILFRIITNMTGRCVIPVAARSKAWGLRPFACWYCGFESHRGYG
jgi:hypothetical protein